MLNIIIKKLNSEDNFQLINQKVIKGFVNCRDVLTLHMSQECQDILDNESLKSFVILFDKNHTYPNDYFELDFEKMELSSVDGKIKKNVRLHQILLSSTSFSFDNGKVNALINYLKNKTEDSLKKLSRTVVISTRENDSWLSMQEIIPLLEYMWGGATDYFNEIDFKEVKGINKKNTHKFLVADNIVLTSFSISGIKFIKYLRTEFNLDFRFVFHLHGFSTFACWPLYHWGLGSYLDKNDVFISTCSRDKETFHGIFNKARCEIIPFSLPAKQISLLSNINFVQDDVIRFIFVGRISEQKNLHSLIYAFSKLSGELSHAKLQLDIYGKEDNLGSPHIGKISGPYMNKLQTLIKSLKNRSITLHGFCERSVLEKMFLKKKMIFCSLSIHSDENFGMSAFRALCFGHIAVLSDWGGHADLCESFSEGVLLVPVRESEFGPFTSITQIKEKLHQALKMYSYEQQSILPDCYSYESLCKKARSILQLPKLVGHLPNVEIVNKIISNYKLFKRSQKDSSKIFSSYGDKDYKYFLRSYGMVDEIISPVNIKAITLLPWIDIIEGRLQLGDMHRGESNIDLELKPDGPLPVFDHKDNKRGYLEELQGVMLVKNGYAEIR
ncbi:MAG: glycosyltransferase family 4 protein [Bacteriovoracaceae bacterium]|jgi:glycosyltransferase involved in cell wall biosynthesis|nr:glycosyltransferase family 4 protein [Bacteriovoracaceae bacterium]